MSSVPFSRRTLLSAAGALGFLGCAPDSDELVSTQEADIEVGAAFDPFEADIFGGMCFAARLGKSPAIDKDFGENSLIPVVVLQQYVRKDSGYLLVAPLRIKPSECTGSDAEKKCFWDTPNVELDHQTLRNLSCEEPFETNSNFFRKHDSFSKPVPSTKPVKKGNSRVLDVLTNYSFYIQKERLDSTAWRRQICSSK